MGANFMPDEPKPLEVLSAARAETLTAKDGSRLTLDLVPPITQVELKELESGLGRPIPADVRDLLLECRGFRFAPVGEIDFSGQGMSVETFFATLPILADGSGNFWVLDLETGGRGGGPVLFWCHDPAVMVIQSPTLSAFLRQVVEVGRAEHNDKLGWVRKERSRQIWANDPYLVPRHEVRDSNDPVIAAFARSLSDSYSIADLRKAEIGSGLSWGKSDSAMKRYGSELLFAVERQKSLFNKIFRRP